jgi:diguanylate cyclase (GGDEF)-like protein
MDFSQTISHTFMNAVISDSTGILLLGFLIVALSVDRVFNRQKTHILLAAAITLLVILVTTGILHILVDLKTSDAVVSFLAATVLTLNLVVLHLLVLLSIDGKKPVGPFRKANRVLLMANTGLCLSNPFTGLLFTINNDFGYESGPLWTVPMVIIIVYVGIIIYTSAHSTPTIKRSETAMVTAVTLMLLPFEIGAILPGFPQSLWNGIAALLVMYYLSFLVQDSHHDRLTGILNRNVFSSDIDRINQDGNTALVLLDVDDLKLINDSQGHLAGDVVIHETGQLLLKVFSGFGVPYRIGGDEFVVICRNRHHADLEKKLGLFDQEQQKLDWSISYGVAWCNPGVNPRTLIHDVDVTMYTNKKMAHALQKGFIYEEGESNPFGDEGRVAARIDTVDRD